MKKRFLVPLIIFLAFVTVIPNLTVDANAPWGIKNNGLGGISIDINSAPYTTFAGYSYGQYAYTSSGCAWFASARVNQLTGKGNTIYSGSTWYNTAYSYFGFSRGSTPQSGSLICWSGHVAILEKIEGSYAYISEGGYGSAGSNCGYCQIDKISISSIPSHTSGFLGYVYMGMSAPSAPTNCQSASWDDRVQIQWNTVNNASGYECGLIDINTRETIVKTTNTEADWYHNFYNVPEGQYYAYVSAYNSAGYSSHSNWYRVDVTYTTPDRPTITANYSNVRENEAVTVSWGSTNNASEYVYYLTEYPVGFAYSTNTRAGHTTNTSITFDNLTSGEYSCFIHAVSNKGKWGAQSNWISFNVYADDYIPTKTVVANNHIYALYDYEMSWSFARDLCKDFGGNLVTVTSTEENQVVADLIKHGAKDAYWLGATDGVYGTEKDFKWVTGEAFSYSNWMSGEPSSSGTDGEKEHFIEIRKSYGNKWNDVNNISKSNKGFILEVDISDIRPTAEAKLNNNKYLLFDKNTTWTEAKTICEQYGGHLAAIESMDESSFVKNFLKSGERSWYYLGGQKKNDVWKWENGSNAEYISWADNASAAWDGKNLMMYKSSGNCIGLHNAYFPEKDIASIGFICEIEDYYNDEPVNTPLPTLKPAAEPSPLPYDGTVSVGNVSGSVGDEVTVPVSISDNPGVSSFTLRLNFDKTKLTPVSVTKNSALPGALTSNVQQSGIDKNGLSYVTAVWANETNYSDNGVLFEVKFKIVEDVSNGEDIPISIKYSKGNIVNQDLIDVDLNLTNGNISIGKIIYGDIYGDGTVNNKDLVRLRQYLAEWNITLTENERKAADVFYDGEVNNKDLVRLSQYLADWDVKLGE